MHDASNGRGCHLALGRKNMLMLCSLGFRGCDSGCSGSRELRSHVYLPTMPCRWNLLQDASTEIAEHSRHPVNQAGLPR